LFLEKSRLIDRDSLESYEAGAARGEESTSRKILEGRELGSSLSSHTNVYSKNLPRTLRELWSRRRRRLRISRIVGRTVGVEVG